MADSKHEKHDKTKQAPKVDKKGELSEKDLEKATGGSGGDRPTES
ncbi:MAG: hypothetical protein ABSF45_10190 [Terriglobia bacterium]|jgi:hypothetical protein